MSAGTPAENRKIKTVRLIQPPLIQLNGPYPAPYYLRSFFTARGYEAAVRDHAIGLFERIFCRKGLETIFAAVWREHREGRIPPARPRAVSNAGIQAQNKNTIYYIERFLSEEARWLNAIDRLTALLRGQDREWGHLLALGNGALPGGPRFDAALTRMLATAEGSPANAVPLLASKLLEDLADFITITLDPGFSLIRYSPRLACSAGLEDFSQVETALESYVLRSFYGPLLEDEWKALAEELAPGEPFILALTIPFPGCLAGSLVCAASAKQHFGERVQVIAGGGYVNTELRFLEEAKFFDYVDYLSFDRGWGSLEAVLEHLNAAPEDTGTAAEPRLYKTMYRSRRSGRVIKGAGLSQDGDEPCVGPAAVQAGGITMEDTSHENARFSRIDAEEAVRRFPDYTGLDFSRYLYIVDDANPMHRLWSDGHWLKAYLAHGCYWRRCAFCDTGLDYIHSFAPVDVKALFRHLLDQAEKTGVGAVHLVDEAAPAASLLALAGLNREAGLPLLFWGNIRFDRDFSPDVTALLAAGGLLGVSGGIEVATEEGFRRLGKGIGLRDVVRACAAFKEQGILTHGYLMYGYWDQDEREIVDSVEIVRQLFAEGLLDSAFWHQFVLTRHSRLYAEYRRGSHPRLKVREAKREKAAGTGRFALNDLVFEGEARFYRFAEPLDRLLAAWMAGDTVPENLARAFSFKIPRPSVSPFTVTALLDEYAGDRDHHRAERPGESGPRGEARVVFLGSRPIPRRGPQGTNLFWRWRTEDHRLYIQRDSAGSADRGAAEHIITFLESASFGPGLEARELYRRLETLLDGETAKRAWKMLRNGGLVYT